MKLYYFDIYGRGEAIRMLLNYTKIEFEDIRTNPLDWPTFKTEN